MRNKFYQNAYRLSSPLMHKTRRQSLFSAIESAMNGGSLSITGLGRDIESQAMGKHKIKRVDRLCSKVIYIVISSSYTPV
jgi:hypothetical protein